MNSPFYTDDHERFRATVRRFVQNEIDPYAHEWDEAGGVPRELHLKAAATGMFALNFPEAFGGVAADPFYVVIMHQELARCGAGGIYSALLSFTIAAFPIARIGSEALKSKVLPGVLSGEKIAALAVTEPSGGSDVANLRTTARLDGDHYVLNGEKTFISGGIKADYIVVAARTGARGLKGISLFLIEGTPPGMTKTPLKKMGWLASDTATLHFDECRVPASNLVGEENVGFASVVTTFNDERLGLAASSISYSRIAYEEALEYARMRTTFGKRLIDHQVIRHKFVDMLQRINASQALLEMTAWRMQQGLHVAADLAILKNQATQTMAFCASEAVQTLGGAGFIRGGKIERIYREVKVNAIGGGAEEIMKDLVARQMGY
jgi:acyl-CoA dehydrogenase